MSHVLQPLDVGVFACLKRAWQDAVAQYQLDEGEIINKKSLAGVFHFAYKNAVRLNTIVNAYKATGICPVNRHAINPKKLEPASVYLSQPSPSSNEASLFSWKPGQGASKLALKALKDELDDGVICLFNKRYKEVRIDKLPCKQCTDDMNRRRSASMSMTLTLTLSEKWNMLPSPPLVLSSTGGMGTAATVFYQRLASMLSEKRGIQYSKTIGWLRCRMSFALLRCSTMCIRGASSSQHHPATEAIDLQLAEGQLH